MNSKNIECFIALAETKSFSMVANQLYLSPSAVSYQIKKLEEELGFNLFLRNTHQVELTEAGEYYLQEIKKLLKLHESILMKSIEINEKKNYFYVGLTAEVAVYHYAYLQEAFHKKYPNVRLIPVPVSFKDGCDPLIYKTVDIMFTYLCRTIPYPEISTSLISTSQFYCVINVQDELSKKEYINPIDLNNHTLFVSVKDAPWIQKMITEIEENGGKIQVKEVEFNNLAISMVKENLGVTIYPYPINVSEDSDIRYVPINSSYFVNRVLAWRSKDQNELISTFCDLSKKRLDKSI